MQSTTKLPTISTTTPISTTTTGVTNQILSSLSPLSLSTIRSIPKKVRTKKLAKLRLMR